MSVFSRVKFTVEEEEEDEGQESGLLVELEGRDEKKERETNMWFSKVFYIMFSLMVTQTGVCLFIHIVTHLPHSLHL